MPVSPISLDTVLVIIPILNEEVSIVSVIQAFQALGLRHIVVVDNGSSDRGPDLAAQAGAKVRYERRRGYGMACWHGLQAMPASVQWVLFCDGDGSDDLGAIPAFLALAQQGVDLVLGDRTATPAGRAALTPAQRFGNRLATTLIWLGWGHRYRDLGPLRLIRRSALEQIQMRDRGFGWTVEMQVRAVECGFTWRELPVAYRPRQGGKSKISGTLRGSFQAGVIILGTLGWLYGRRLRQGMQAWQLF
ncbi:MAG: glycosyltransferase family 2 protein [Leptolyngbyaceae cyanobacterium T60_A2020_046]|nr:glycosyltransferase family 2 protein [Leptolyngbyaceae cyanobacterium T60_A2020_046]